MPYTRAYNQLTTWPRFAFENGLAVPGNGVFLVEFVGGRTGERMEGWRSLVRTGANAATPYESDRYSVTDVKEGAASLHFSFQADAPDADVVKQDFHGFIRTPGNPLAHLPASSVTANAAALTSVLRKIKSELSQVSGASTLAEFGDVLRQFGKPFDAIIDLTNRRLNRLQLEARGLRGSVIFKKIKFAEIVASTYLEYAFGLAPLINDTKKAAEAYARFTLEQEELVLPRSKVVGRGLDRSGSDSYQDEAVNNTFIRVLTRFKTVTEARGQYVVGLGDTLRAAPGSNARLQQLLGFDPKDWIPAAWEVVPWSWLIDYFSNVGDILNAAATSTSNVTWIVRTDTRVTTHDCVSMVKADEIRSYINGRGWYVVSLSGKHTGAFQVVRRTMSRTIPQTLGVPPVVFKLPSELGQLANMAAVLVSRKPKASALWLT